VKQLLFPCKGFEEIDGYSRVASRKISFEEDHDRERNFGVSSALHIVVRVFIIDSVNATASLAVSWGSRKTK